MYRCVRLGPAPRRRSAYNIKVPQERFEKHAEPVDQWEPSRLFSVALACFDVIQPSFCMRSAAALADVIYVYSRREKAKQ